MAKLKTAAGAAAVGSGESAVGEETAPVETVAEPVVDATPSPEVVDSPAEPAPVSAVVDPVAETPAAAETPPSVQPVIPIADSPLPTAPSAPAADDDAEYLAGVLRKQGRLESIEDGRKAAKRLPTDVATQVVALGRVGRVSELRALLNLE